MSSGAKKVSKQILNQRINTIFQVMALVEAEAKKKNWFQRFAICWKYLWFKKFDAFFK